EPLAVVGGVAAGGRDEADPGVLGPGQVDEVVIYQGVAVLRHREPTASQGDDRAEGGKRRQHGFFHGPQGTEPRSRPPKEPSPNSPEPGLTARGTAGGRFGRA